MKKSLVALAALAATASFAQSSSLTISGDIWGGVQQYTSSANTKATIVGNGPAATRLRFVGTEAMGGGNTAKFHLEMQPNLNGGSSSTLFNRGAWAGLGGGWGEIRVGRQSTVAMGLICGVDQGACLTGFNGGGILFNGTNSTGRWISGNVSRGLPGNAGMNPATTGGAGADVTRVINAFSYLTPNLSGFTGQLMYGSSNLNNNQVNDQGNASGASLNYANGPFMVGLAHQTAQADPGRNASGSQTTLGGTFDLGFAKFGAIVQEGKATLGAGVSGFGKEQGWALTATAPLGNFAPYLRVGEHKVSGGSATGNVGAYGIAGGKDAKMFNLGANYNLSKRTKLNLDYATDGAGNSGRTNAGALSTAAGSNVIKPKLFYVGVEHHF